MTSAEIEEFVIGAIRYRDWRFIVGLDGDRMFLQAAFVRTCADTGLPTAQRSRKWWLSPHMTRSEIVTTALKAVLTAEEHEVRECFTYRGEAIFGPHHDVEALVDLCRAGRQERRHAG